MTRILLALILFATLAGCARTPAGGGVSTGTRLIFTMRMDSAVRTGTETGSGGIPYIYMVALRTSDQTNPTDQGPIPVVAPPWGNGFVAGNATHFVWWDPTQVNQYTIYRFTDALLNQFAAVGVPVNDLDVRQGDSVLQFEINLGQLEADPVALAKLKSLQVNFLTMDRIPQTGSDKLWDAIGDGRLPSQVNHFLTISLLQNGTYTNQRSGEIEPRGDQPDPSLDIVDWSIEVRLQ